MKHRIFSLLLASLITLSACGGPASLTNPGKPAEGVTVTASEYTDAADFCSDFAAAAAALAPTHQNTLTSPLSAYLALSMAAFGANGSTRDEFDAVMGTPDGDGLFRLTSHLTDLGDTTLSIANSAWLDEGLVPEQAWLDSLANHLLAPVFQTELDNAAGKVNAWIEEHTNGLIRDMLADGSTKDMRAMLINALYLDASWADEFDADDTIRGRKFTNFDGGVSIADYLYAKDSQLVIDDGDHLGVVLPYSDGSLAFVAVMSNDPGVPAASVTQSVCEAGGFAALADTARSEMVKLYLPKFEHSTSLSLKKMLGEMGIKAAFDPNTADFSGITSAESLYISDVLQNAVLRIDEAGTEAAAATAVIMCGTGAMLENEIRVIDFCRPFSFAVIDRTTGAVLFCGEHNVA